MKIAICDNNINDALSIKNMVLELMDDNTEITVINSSEDFIKQIKLSFDVVIMDIILDNDISGIELIKQTAPDHPCTTVIFVSSNPEFFMDVYSVDHIHFITKPIDKNVLAFALNKAKNLYAKRYITLSMNGVLRKIDHKSIIYAESFRHKSVIHLVDNSKLDAPLSIKQLSKLLGDFEFLRCHKSFCINMDHVSQYTKSSLLMDSGIEIPIGRIYSSEVKDKILQFWGNEL